MGDGARNKGVKSIYRLVLGIFKRFSGTLPSFGASGQELFWKTNPLKRVVFFNQSQVLGLFFGGVGKIYEVCDLMLRCNTKRISLCLKPLTWSQLQVIHYIRKEKL